jgi:hypothetical protein
MKYHCIYKTKTGQIVSCGSCPENEIDGWCNSDESWIFVDKIYDGSSEFVMNKKIVSLPKKPKEAHFFNYETKKWEKIFEISFNQAISKRNKLLLESDWTQLPDAPVNKQAWAEYRQALRDITHQTGFPTKIEWPLAPNEE